MTGRLTCRPWTLLTLLSLTVFVLVLWAQSWLWTLFPECAIHRMTGYFCPGCGGRRALMMLARGEWREALRMNPLLILGGLVGGGFMVQQSMGEWREPPVPPVSWRWWHTAGVLGLILAFGILRNLPIEPFVRWAPVPLR